MRFPLRSPLHPARVAPVSTSFRPGRRPAFGLLAALLFASRRRRSDDDDIKKEIADVEKQIADLQKKLDDLKNGHAARRRAPAASSRNRPSRR